MSQIVLYSFLFIWQNKGKGSIWKEPKLTVRKYKNIDNTAVLIYFLFLSPNGKKKKLYFFGSTYNNMDLILIRHLLHIGCTNPCSAFIMQPLTTQFMVQ